MPRRLREAPGGVVYHVLNRAVGRTTLFQSTDDYQRFESVLEETHDRTGIRILSYCLMPDHWHMLLRPREDGELSEVMRWLTVTHTQRCHSAHGTSGTGPIYQGRFRSFPVQNNQHFLDVARYVEQNPLRARLIKRAQDWQWSSLWRRSQRDKLLVRMLSRWPIMRPADWTRRVNRSFAATNLAALRRCVNRGQPYGNSRWIKLTAERLDLESTLRPRGRPRLRSAD